MQVVSVYTFGSEDTPISARDKIVRRENTLGVHALQILACVCNAAKVRHAAWLDTQGAQMLTRLAYNAVHCSSHG